MGMCKACGEVFNTNSMVDGYCENCIASKQDESFRIENQKQEEIKQNEKVVDSIIITTENIIDFAIESRITIVSAQCIFGINILKDMFSFVRDIVGGRVNSLENGLDEATQKILIELKQKAYILGGDAVIGVKIEHTYNNANSGSILSVFGTGTVVKLKKESEDICNYSAPNPK